MFIFYQEGVGGRCETHRSTRLLDPGWVEHDADAAAHGLGRQVALELGADRAGVTVGPGHL